MFFKEKSTICSATNTQFKGGSYDGMEYVGARGIRNLQICGGTINWKGLEDHLDGSRFLFHLRHCLLKQENTKPYSACLKQHRWM